jgi:uncharacterized membrane protein YgcG
MSPYDVAPDDEPLDMGAVGWDHELVEGLRRSLSPQDAVIWDDDEDDLDPAVALLRALQRDVSADLPAGTVLPAGVTPLVSRRRLGRGATVAAIAAGVLSIGGVAAASAPGQPLSGLRSAVASAMGSVVDAVTPDAPVGPAVAEPTKSAKPTAKPTTKPTATPAGAVGGAAARSAAAAKQVTAELEKAARFMDRGSYTAARNALDNAARKLPLVTDAATHDRLATQLSTLRSRLASPRPEATKPGDARDDRGGKTKPTDKPDNSGKGSDNSGKGSDNSGKGSDDTGKGSSGSGSGASGRSTKAPSPKVKVPEVEHTSESGSGSGKGS